MASTTRPRPTSGRVMLAALVSAALLAATPASASPDDGRARALLGRDVRAIHAEGIVGVLGEAVGPRGRRSARAGVADLATRRPVPYNGYIRIGSTTKTFVATVVLQLAGERHLSLDDTLQRWLPGVVAGNGNDGRAITVRQLLQHTSGLYDYTLDVIPGIDTPAEYRRNRQRTYTAEQLVAMAMRHQPNFAPGTSWSYSNTNYVLAGMLIERVTGRSWEREVRERILEPLGLRHTLTPDRTTRLPNPHATIYQQFTPGGPAIDVTLPPLVIESGADGSMISTTADVNRFFRALLGGALFGPRQLAEMRQTVPATEWESIRPGVRYGLGLIWRPLSCTSSGYWSHGGNGLGYTVEDGVTDDGGHSVVVSLSSRGVDPAADLQQRHGVDLLVEHALCAS